VDKTSAHTAHGVRIKVKGGKPLHSVNDKDKPRLIGFDREGLIWANDDARDGKGQSKLRMRGVLLKLLTNGEISSEFMYIHAEMVIMMAMMMTEISRWAGPDGWWMTERVP